MSGIFFIYFSIDEFGFFIRFFIITLILLLNISFFATFLKNQGICSKVKNEDIENDLAENSSL